MYNMENDERTPLIATVRVAPPRHRYHGHVVRRFCNVACGSTLLFIVIFALLPTAFFKSWHGRWPDYLNPHDPLHDTAPISYVELQKIIINTPDEENVEAWSKYYTAGPHLAGKNFSQALWTQQRWQEWGVASSIATYDCYLNYPLGHRLALYKRVARTNYRNDGFDATKSESWKIEFEASLEEDVLEEDGTSGLEDRIPTFHGYSASGNVTASFVYVNYGTYWDFEDLINANVSLKGKIAIAKYGGGIFRGLKVKRAQELGMIGIVIYSDPGDDGSNTHQNGKDTYPKGPARNPSSVQRGSTQFLSVSPGDPTTPGYPSLPGAPRQPVDNAIPSIPSIPISYADAIPILKSLNGHGPNAKDFNSKYWTGNLGLEYKGVEYNVGPSPDDLVLNLVNDQDYVTTPIWNVIGIINGTLADEVVVMGNHRDAWVAGGAGDPGSGSAPLNEVIRSFGEALKLGWKPLRTIVFASWDGEEYGLVGSTEWVEEYLPWLSTASVAYVNVDVGCVGPVFGTAASPLLHKVIRKVTSLVPSPNQTVIGQTVRDLWDGHINTMGSGSDFTAFQDFAGIPSIDMGFHADGESPIYHYHSNYDSFHWMSTYGDPGFRFHVTAAQILGLIVAMLSETPIIPMSISDYSNALKDYVEQVASKLKTYTRQSEAADDDNLDFSIRSHLNPLHVVSGDLNSLLRYFKRLDRAVANLQLAAGKFDARAGELAEEAGQDIPWWKWWSRWKLFHEIRKANGKIKYFERQFLYEKGLDGRSWFKHVVFAPGLWTGYSGAVFPSLAESIDAKDYRNAERWILIIERILEKARKSLE